MTARIARLFAIRLLSWLTLMKLNSPSTFIRKSTSFSSSLFWIWGLPDLAAPSRRTGKWPTTQIQMHISSSLLCWLSKQLSWPYHRISLFSNLHKKRRSKSFSSQVPLEPFKVALKYCLKLLDTTLFNLLPIFVTLLEWLALQKAKKSVKFRWNQCLEERALKCRHFWWIILLKSANLESLVKKVPTDNRL